MTMLLAFFAGCVTGWAIYRITIKAGILLFRRDDKFLVGVLGKLTYDDLIRFGSAVEHERIKREEPS